MVLTFPEQFCKNKAFESEGGENLSVALAFDFRSMCSNALPFLSCRGPVFVLSQPPPRTMQDLSNQIKLSVEYRQQCRQAGVNPKNLWHLNASVGEWFGGRSRPTNCSTAFLKILKYFECDCPGTIAIQFTD